MAIKILNKSEKRKIENKLGERFGIKKIPGFLAQFGKERLYIFTGNISPKEIIEISDATRIERIGVYFAKIVPGEEDLIRLSIEGSQILQDQITKNVFELNDIQAQKWMEGKSLDIQLGEERKGFLVMRHGSDFLGAGKASIKKIGNFIPKNRRLKPKQ